MLAHTAWDLRMKARLTASFGLPYDYAGISYPEAPMSEPLREVCRLLRKRLGFEPNNCLVNYYPDGRSKMGFHSDDITELADDTGVAIVSLGASRPLRFRLLGDPTIRWELTQPPGSMLYMPQEVHRRWAHAIPRRKYAEPRISLTFRKLAPVVRTAVPTSD
ncbi:MAG: alpha-ketoglutarate-dependent dioxygenase AlkB [Armatimonadetes bacterium]|nr:alpha-ketoglutarate-dependent dioxygenase AlkB [Armatimonadota bacterium]